MILSILNYANKHILILCLLFCSLVFLIFYPQKYTNIDEHDYLNNASLLLNGGLKRDCSENILGQWSAGDYCISKYNIGTSFFLIPAALTDPHLAFLITFVIFLSSIVVFHELLKIYKIRPVFVLLFAFYPAFIYFSRTLFSEIYSTFLILTGFYLLRRYIPESRKSLAFLAGVILGMSIFVRYTNVIPVLTIIVVFCWDYRKNLKEAIIKGLPVIFGFIPVIILILLFNKINYGGFLRSGYYYAFEEVVFSPEQIPLTLLRYSLLLIFLYPGMIILALLSKLKDKSKLMLIFFSELIFYLLIRNLSFGGKITDIIFGARYILPVLPFLMLLYFDYLNRHFDKRVKLFVAFLCLVFGVGVIAISYLHFVYLASVN